MTLLAALLAIVAASLAWTVTAKTYMGLCRHMKVERVLRWKPKTRGDAKRMMLAAMFKRFPDARYAGVVIGTEAITLILVSKSACKNSLAGKSLTKELRDIVVQAVGKRVVYGLSTAGNLTEFSAMIYDNPPFDVDSPLSNHSLFTHWTDL